ncbi:hypothetical protein [Brevibacillus massiliensis]|jgi:hypothetical protein|uniref:hypothetical protein n=1 Tax=Brevibacillus massiliensis TaxID=1118054 RepID=UPI00031B153F|nr:hypothetical protein [Brevibacillus massiliensis]
MNHRPYEEYDFESRAVPLVSLLYRMEDKQAARWHEELQRQDDDYRFLYWE